MSSTWQQVRDVRDGHLHETDAKVGMTDAPDELQDAWKDYRQKLRDPSQKNGSKRLYTLASSTNVSIMSKDMRDPKNSTIPNDPYRDGAFPKRY